MKKKPLLSIIIISIAFIFGCNNQYNIGRNIIPSENFANVGITDTVTVLMYTDSIKSLRSDGISNLLIGKYTDPSFGITEASFMTQIMQLDYPEWGDSAILDSVCLALPLAEDYYYGENEMPPNLSVYRIKDSLRVQNYYSDENPGDYTNYELLGSGASHKFVSTDSVDSYNPGIELRLDDVFGQSLIDQSDYYFNSSEHFYFLFGGIYVKSNSSNGIYKIRTDVSLESKNFGIIIFYHFPSSSSETLRYVLPITSSSIKFNMFSHDYTGTAFESELTDSSPSPSQYVYLQSMAGTKVKLTFPGLLNLDKDIIINKAELILKDASASVLGDYKPVDEVWLLGRDSDNNVVFFKDFYSTTYYGFENIENQYTINLTRIVQDYIAGAYQNQDIYLDLRNSIVDFKRTILTNGIDTENPPKLVITYTKID